MCGRFNVTDNPQLTSLLERLGIDLRLPTRVNIAPTEQVAIVIHQESERQIRDMRWWLVPSWAKEVSTRYSMFNARAETLETSRAFRGPFRHRRGIIPASSFIEWKSLDGKKQPWLVERTSNALAFAAIWESRESGDEIMESCAIVTVEAAAGVKRLHSRMPLMLEPELFETWLDPAVDIDQLRKILVPHVPTGLQRRQLSMAINNSRTKTPELLVGLSEAENLEQ